MDFNSQLNNTLDLIRRQVTQSPEIALILGSGLGDFANELTDPISLPTVSLPSYPVSTVQGHAGRLVFGRVISNGIASKPLLVFQGRVHYYETHDIQRTLLPIRIAKELGAHTLIVTNAAGGINPLFSAGDLMLIEDVFHLFLPLRSANLHSPLRHERNLFNRPLGTHILNRAMEMGLPIRKGTYCWLTGPSYETPAEIEMIRRLGADAVGMSTVPEVFEAKGLGMRVAGVSLISNLAAGMSGQKLSHDEVTQTAKRVKESFTEFMRRVLLTL